MKICFVFPGQGSQHVGMGKDLYDGFEEVRALYKTARETLGYDMAELSFSGPEAELNRTVKTQPALLVASLAAHTLLTLKGIYPYMVAGHSLGEYSALAAAGALSFRDAVKITALRGKIMQEAVPEGKGMMAAILGLDREKVDSICKSAKKGYVAAANYNCPGQIVISGERPAVEEAIEQAKKAGAKKAVALQVSVPSHSKLMEEASKRLSEFLFLEGMEITPPGVPLVTNAEAKPVKSVDGIKEALVKQLSGPVLWEDSLKVIRAFGCDIFVEVGPGKVLTGLIKRTLNGVKIYNVQDRESLEKTLEALK